MISFSKLSKIFSILTFCAAEIFGVSSSVQAAEQSAIKTPPISNSRESLHAGFAPVIAAAMPSVVTITSILKKSAKTQTPEPQLGAPSEKFLEHYQHGDGSRIKKETPRNIGSGFIIDKVGHIVTNAHVIEEAENILVTLENGEQLQASLVGKDLKTDLAILKIETSRPIKPIIWGDSDAMNVGDWVLAIGNPFGLGNSVSSGILSAKARERGVGPYDDFLQTDAAINRGNSGGPLLNHRGEVIGVSTAIFSPTGENIGIAFAVPSILARWVAEEICNFGSPRRGWLGVKIESISSGEVGAVVTYVEPGSPAEKAGIFPGDRIESFNGTLITQTRQLPRLVAAAPAGSTALIRLKRQQNRMEFQVKIVALASE